MDFRRAVVSCLVAAVLLTASCRSNSQQSFPFIPGTSGSVSGIVSYQDKEYDSLGFTGTNPYKTVRSAVVEVVDSSSGKVLASGTTGANGSYDLSYSGAGSSIYVRVLAEAELNNASLIRVRNLGGATYAVGSGSFSSGGAATKNIDIDLVTYSQVSGAFNILDVLLSGMQFVHGLAGVYPAQLSAFWEYNSPYGTFYCLGICLWPGIYIIGNDGGDTDGYDDDVIWHEFGHFIADKFSKDDSPGGYHELGWNDEDLRLSWSEGWGNFFPLAVKNWLSATDPTRLSATALTSPSLYLDTVNDVAWIAFDFGNPLDNTITCLPGGTSLDCFNYSSNEAAVANILWNTMTGAGNFGMQPIWNVFNQSLPTATWVNLEAFWDGWISQRSPGGNEYDPSYTTELSTLWSIYAPLNGPLPGPPNIFYRKDTYDVVQDDGSFGTATSIDAGAANFQTHYLYKASGIDDSDYYAFSTGAAGNFTVATSGLANGADTFITVYNEAGANITSNDNFQDIPNPPNDGLSLSSKAAFNATAAANYFIEVKPSPNRPLSAGRYGTYTLTITSP